MSRYEYVDGKLVIDLGDLVADGMTDDEREALIGDALRHISFDDAVARAVIDRLTNKNYEWWSGSDPELRHYALCQMEHELISGHQWYWLSWLKDAVKDIHNDKRLYWMLYHDDELGDRFREWCKRRDIESNYDEHKEADVAKILEGFDTAIANLKAGIPVPDKERD